MIIGYVVEEIKNGKVTHIYTSNINEASKIVHLISSYNQGGVYPLYNKQILIVNKQNEDEDDFIFDHKNLRSGGKK